MNVTGAGGAIPRDDNERMDAHAEMFYEEIRKRKSDVTAIAKNTGFSAEDIDKIKQHVFIDKHDLGTEELSRFTPDYDMAVSWQRLIDGRNIKEMDIVLLNHELVEARLMSEGISYEKAHSDADAVYSYTKYVRELDAKEGIL